MFVGRKIEENCLFSKILTLGHMFAAFQAGEYSRVQDCRPQLSRKSVACMLCRQRFSLVIHTDVSFCSRSVGPPRVAALQ